MQAIKSYKLGYNNIYSKKKNRAERRKVKAKLTTLNIKESDFLELPLKHKHSALYENL